MKNHETPTIRTIGAPFCGRLYGRKGFGDVWEEHPVRRQVLKSLHSVCGRVMKNPGSSCSGCGWRSLSSLYWTPGSSFPGLPPCLSLLATCSHRRRCGSPLERWLGSSLGSRDPRPLGVLGRTADPVAAGTSEQHRLVCTGWDV